MSRPGLKRKLSVLALVSLMAAVLAACGAQESGQQEPGQAQPEQAEPEQAEQAEPEQAPEEDARDSEPMELTEVGDDGGAAEGGEDGGEAETPLTAAGEPAEVRDGVWAVGDAGEVEFAVENGALQLVDARPSDGWRMDIDEQAPDEIEVDFERGNVEWEIEIETDGNRLEIEIDQDIDPAEAGAYEIGNAGIVEVSLGDAGLSLIEATPNEGWDYVIDEESSEEIEVEFTSGDVKWDFDAEYDDGVLDIEIDQEIVGPVPNP